MCNQYRECVEKYGQVLSAAIKPIIEKISIKHNSFRKQFLVVTVRIRQIKFL